MCWEDHKIPAKQFHSEELSIGQIEQEVQFNGSFRLHKMISQYLDSITNEQTTVLLLPEFILKKSNQVLALKRDHKIHW
jgi:hypothetical protein